LSAQRTSRTLLPRNIIILMNKDKKGKEKEW
jgi:hypothetical protein